MNKFAKAARDRFDPRLKHFPLPEVKPNKADHKAKEKRVEKRIDFTGKVGLARSQVNFGSHTVFKKKPKAGTAAKVRAKPFTDETTDAMKAHHVHPRHKRTVKPRTKANARKVAAIKRTAAEKKAKLVKA